MSSPEPAARGLRSRWPRTAGVALAWAVAVVVATLIGLTAVGAIGSGIVGAGQDPLTPAEVDAALASATGAPAAQAPAAAPTTAPAATPQTPGAGVVSTAGGTVIARCTAGRAEVVSATPAQGYRLHDEVGEDPGRVRFESGNSKVEVRLSCRDGVPVGEIKID